MVKRLVGLACAGALWLSGCAVGSSWGSAGEPIEGDVRTSNKPLEQDSEVIYLLLAAELAGQRGQYEVALDNYLKVARRTSNVQVAERATQIALYLKDSEKAEEAASLWAARDPNSVAAHRVAAMLSLKSGQTDKAIEQFRALLALRDPEIENTLIEMVKWLDAELPKEQAMDSMRRLAAAFHNLAEVHFAYALLASGKGEQQVALSETQRALALHPDWSRARLLQAQVMSQMGDSAAAREAVQKALKTDPGNARLRLIYSQFLAKSGDYKGAERELLRILEKSPSDHDARFALGSAYLDMGQQDRAKQEFIKLTEVAKWQFQSDFYLGVIEARQGRLEQSLRWFERITTGPLEFDAKVNAITALINLGRLDEARQRLARVRKGFPNEAVRLYLLEAELLSKNKDYASAFDVLTEGLEELPGQPELLYSRALVAEQLDRIDAAEADLKAVLEKNPNDPSALNALGYTLADRGTRLDEAKVYLDRAIEMKPDDPAIMDSYGWLQYRLGNKQEALKLLRKAYEQVADPEIGAHLGEVLWESGQRQEAKRVWKESFRKDPNQDDIKRVRAKYKDGFQ